MAQTTPPGYDTPLTDADVRPDRAEGGGGILNALTTTQSEGQSPLDKAIEAHHQRRLHEAQMWRDNASTYAAALMHGIDPKTGQPLTPEQEQEYTNKRDAAQTAYEKAAGVNKDTKGVLQQARTIVDHLVHAGRQQRGLTPLGGAAAGTAPTGASGGTTPDSGIQAPKGGTAPMPGPGNTAVSGSGGGTAPSGGYPLTNVGGPRMTPPPAQAAAATSQQGQTPPPAYDMKTAALEAPELRRMLEERTQDERAFGKFSREKELEHKYKMEELTNKSHKYITKEVDDPDSPGQKKLVAIDPNDPTQEAIDIKGSSGDPLRPGTKATAGEGKLEIPPGSNGIPTGRVMHGGKYVAPGEPGYTEADAKAVDAAMAVNGLSEKQRERLASIRGESYALAKARYGTVSTVDENGEVGFTSPLEINRNPGKYTPTSEAEKISTRERVHSSLNANMGALEKSLDALPNGLDLKTQAVVEAALRSDDPGMLETLLTNQVKANAPTPVIQYLTNVKAMQEDILTLRNVGGMGQGSDLMRGAMMRLIPGQTSGSVSEAKMQIGAAKRTMDSLFAGAPHAKFAKPTPPPEPESKVRYTEGKSKWDIPLGQEKEFLKDHPDAKRQ